METEIEGKSASKPFRRREAGVGGGSWRLVPLAERDPTVCVLPPVCTTASTSPKGASHAEKVAATTSQACRHGCSRTHQGWAQRGGAMAVRATMSTCQASWRSWHACRRLGCGVRGVFRARHHARARRESNVGPSVPGGRLRPDGTSREQAPWAEIPVPRSRPSPRNSPFTGPPRAPGI